MPEKIRIGVAGVGYVGRHHARILSGMQGVTLAGVSDRNREKKKTVADPLGAPFFDDYRALGDRVDAVCIAVPTNLHYELARHFLEMGIHVLVEKPVTARLDHAAELVELADRKGALLMVGHTERFNPAMIEARKVLDSPMFIEAHRIGAFPGRSTDVDVILDVMIHDIDLVLGVDRSGVESLEAVGVSVITHTIDIANARLRLRSGCVANLTASRVSQERLRKIRFFGHKQYLSVDCDRQEVRYVTLRPGTEAGKPTIVSDYLEVRADEPLRIELESFVDAIRREVPPEVDGRQGMDSLKVALSIKDGISRWRTGTENSGGC